MTAKHRPNFAFTQRGCARQPSGAPAVWAAPLTSARWTLVYACVLSPLKRPQMMIVCRVSARGGRAGGAVAWPPHSRSVTEKRHVCHRYLRRIAEIRRAAPQQAPHWAARQRGTSRPLIAKCHQQMALGLCNSIWNLKDDSFMVKSTLMYDKK